MAGTHDQARSTDTSCAIPEWLATDYAEIVAERERMVQALLGANGELAPRLREIVALVVCAFECDAETEVHMRRALALGSTMREIVEGIMAASTPGGQPCLHFAIPYLKKLIGELGEKADLKPAHDSAERARTRRDSTGGRWDWIEEHYPDYQKFRRDVNRVLLMPEDATLAPRYREIIVAVILARRAYPTVLHHSRRAIEEGAAFDELVGAMRVGAIFAGLPLLQHAWPILERIRGEIESGALGPA